jgi:hypothetical protein
MHPTDSEFALQAAGFAGHVLLLFVLLLRRLAGRFPWFTAFVCFEVGRSLVLFPAEIHLIPVPYFAFYWALAVVDYFLSLAVIYEIAWSVFRPLGVWARDVRTKLSGWIGAGIAFAVWITYEASPPTRSAYQTLVIKGDFFIGIVMLELFTILMVISSDAGLVWRHHARNIADALAAYSIVIVVVDWAHNYYGSNPAIYAWLSTARIIAYLMVLVYWIVTLWLPEPPRKCVTPEMRTKIFALRARLASDLSKVKGESENLGDSGP